MSKRYLSKLPVYLIYIVLFSATVGYPFFWDTIQLASKHATYFYSTNFGSIILPNEIDSGHIPTLGLYIAAIWKIFGRTLVHSHLAMLPFVIGIVYQTLKLSRNLFSIRWYLVPALIILLDPTLLAQSTLVSPDVLVVFFFLLAINSLMAERRILFALALTGLTLASMRGMMCVAALFVSEVILAMTRETAQYSGSRLAELFKKLKLTIITYLPAAVIAIGFFSWHFHKTGWFAYHENMPWADLFRRTDLKGAIFNVFILGWRLADFGRFMIWMAGSACIWHYLRRRPVVDIKLKTLLIIFLVLLLFLGGTLITHHNLSGHRYLIPLYLTIAVSVVYYLYNIAANEIPRRFLVIIMLAGLLSGNFWVYPDRIAKGWDSTLAYLPYFPLRQKMITFMKEEKIGFEETGTGFPNEDKFDLTDLNGNNNSFARRDLGVNKYIFWSNIYNDFSDAELETINNWEKVKELRSVQVKIVLYRNPELK